MFYVRRPTQKSFVVIRAATGHELSDFEKRKLMNIEDGAQKNKIEVISLNNQRLPIDTVNKEVNIQLGDLALKDKVTPEDISTEDLFYMTCTLTDE